VRPVADTHLGASDERHRPAHLAADSDLELHLSARGGSDSKTGTCTASGCTGSDAHHQALCTATRSGVIFVVAAGNSGANAASSGPAAYDDTLLTVSATDTASAPVALAAPGAGVLSTRLGGGTTTMSGTSMAAPTSPAPPRSP
jgi:subtilisin family serine protease